MAELQSLPPELVSHLAVFLSPKELLVLSGSCHRLRDVLNDNTIWKKYTDGGVVSKALDNVTSTVPPTFSIPKSILKALCEHRLHFLKQSRLLNNIRQRNFISHEFQNVQIPMNFSEFETTKMPTREITYKGIYLFTLSYSNDLTLEEEVDVFNIAKVPKLVTSFRLVNHGDDYSVLIYLEVVDDLLVVRQDDKFDFHKISLPEIDFPHLFTINVNPSQDMEMGSSTIISNAIFIVNATESVVEVWSIISKTKSYCIQPQVEGELRWEALSKDKTNVLFFSDFDSLNLTVKNPHVSVYNIPSRQFTTFSLRLSNEICGFDSKGLINSNYVVLISGIHNVSVFVYDLGSSALVAEKQSLESRYFEHAKIVENNLLFPEQFSINIIDLKSLETVRELHFDCGGLTHELPQHVLIDMQCLSISNISNLVLISKTNGSELWDYELGERLLHFSKPSLYSWVNDTYSMILILDSANGWFKVFNFW